MKTLLCLCLLTCAAIGAESQQDNPWRITDKSAWINWRAVEDPWRVVEGQTNFVPRADDWRLVYSTVISRDANSLLVDGVVSKSAEGSSAPATLMIRNYPRVVVDGDHLDPFVAKFVGSESYITVLGAKRTVRVYDFGKPCAPLVATTPPKHSPVR